MDFLVSYDVNTETSDGERRLRKVAKTCEAFGQRVQKSVFECILDESDFERLEVALLKVIDTQTDSVRIYRLPHSRHRFLRVLGRDLEHDLHGPLIL